MKNTISKLGWFLLIVFLLASALAIPPGTAYAIGAATFTVDSNTDPIPYTSDGHCTLREAISAAVSNITSSECVNSGSGFGDDLIVFSISGNTTITLTANLPDISSGILTIDGWNSGSPVVIDGGSSYRPFNIYSSGSLTLKNLTVQHGYFAGYGGAAYNAGTLNVFNSSFLNNLATFEGGAIENDGTVTIANSTFSGNSAPYGGALQNTSGAATILNSTFSGNTASGHGGALGTWDGGGTSANTAIKNTILANSTAIEDCFNAWASFPGILTGDHNIIETAGSGSTTCSGITTSATDPMLGSLTGSPAYFPLSAGSPAIDTGTNTGCLATDQRGIPRPQDGDGNGTFICDIGAFESQPVFAASPASWNYGWVKVATTTAGKLFTVQNTGTANLVIGTVTLAGAMPTQFHMTANTCSAQTLVPNAICTITATFKPTTAGTKTAYINIPDNALGQPHKIMLSGRGGIELALNGGFNTYPTAIARIPTSWTAVHFAATDGKNTTYKKEGTASVKIANTSVLTKTLTETRPISGVAGNKFRLSLWGKGLHIPTTAGVVRAQVLLYYGATLRQVATITLPNGTYGFTQKTLAFTATRAYNKIVIKLIYSKGTGAEWFDGLSLLRSP